MSKQTNKPLALAIGTLVGGLALSGSAFAMTDLASGYMVAAAHAGAEAGCGADKKAAEAKCGADKKAAEGKCGEGKCGMDVMDTDKDGKVSSAEFAAKHDGDTSKFAMHDTNKDGFISADEAKAAEGKCGGDKAKGEGKCGADKKPADEKAKMEGKCGEGKCGGMA
jgi:uncharacterized low-complexity protein